MLSAGRAVHAADLKLVRYLLKFWYKGLYLML